MSPYANAALNAGTPVEGNPRRTEAWALTEAGRRMALAARGSDLNAMREVLRLNWRLWTIFQADLTLALETPEGAEPVTPSDVTLNMLTLCQFVDKQTVAALGDPSPETMQVLIDINREIAAGLLESLTKEERGEGAAALPEGQPAQVSAYG